MTRPRPTVGGQGLRPSATRIVTAMAAAGMCLVAMTLAGPPSARAAVETGSYAGNSRGQADEPLSFKVMKSKKKLTKAKKKLTKAKKKRKQADTGKARKKANKKVSKAHKKVKKAKRPKLKGFRIDNAVLFCVQEPFQGETGPTVAYPLRMSVPVGNLYEGTNAARLKENGSFSLDFRSNTHPDEGQQTTVDGKVPGDGSANGTFYVEYHTYGGFPQGYLGTLDCRSGNYPPYGPVVYRKAVHTAWDAAVG